MKKNLSLIMILGLNLIFSQVPSYVPTNGLVGWWPFSGNANDESGNENNGTVNGPILTVDRFNNSNSAYSYSNGSNLICTNNIFQHINQLSYSVWFKTNSIQLGHLIGFNNGQCSHGGNWDRALYIEGNKISYYTYPNSQIIHNIVANIIDNTWHHCVITFNNTGSKIYLDGILISSKSNQVLAQSYIGYFRFGGLSPNNLNNSIIGVLDDIGIWNRALTQEEITALYTGILSSDSFTNPTNFQLYPNPSNDVVQYKGTEMVEKISIYNALGQLVQENKTNGMEGSISIEYLTQGTYFVKINNQNTSYTILKK